MQDSLEEDSSGMEYGAWPVKKEHAKDLFTIFSNICKVKFWLSNGAVEGLKGHWCNVCK